ncbi:MAG: hypothetical protein NZM00_11190 [Anaerolinea sp.]|nr:hypothetical protein [Anaerolinea sp.]
MTITAMRWLSDRHSIMAGIVEAAYVQSLSKFTKIIDLICDKYPTTETSAATKYNKLVQNIQITGRFIRSAPGPHAA